MELLLKNGNHLGGVSLHIGILPVRRFALEGGNRLAVGHDFLFGKHAVESGALQVDQLLNGPDLPESIPLGIETPVFAASSVRCS